MQRVAVAGAVRAVVVGPDLIPTSHVCYSSGDCERAQQVVELWMAQPTTNASDGRMVDTRTDSRTLWRTPPVPASADSSMNSTAPELCCWHRSVTSPTNAFSDSAADAAARTSRSDSVVAVAAAESDYDGVGGV